MPKPPIIPTNPVPSCNWLVVMAAESIHGALRMVLLAPLVGDFRARQIAVFTGALIIVAIVASFIRWLRLITLGSMLAVGLMWVVLTVGFEFLLGRAVFGYSWQRVLSDYDLLRGGLLPIGLAVFALSPLIAAWLRRVPFSPLTAAPDGRTRSERSRVSRMVLARTELETKDSDLL